MRKFKKLQLATYRLQESNRAIRKNVNEYCNQADENDRQMTIEDYFPRWEDGDYE